MTKINSLTLKKGWRFVIVADGCLFLLKVFLKSYSRNVKQNKNNHLSLCLLP